MPHETSKRILEEFDDKTKDSSMDFSYKGDRDVVKYYISTSHISILQSVIEMCKNRIEPVEWCHGRPDEITVGKNDVLDSLIASLETEINIIREI